MRLERLTKPQKTAAVCMLVVALAAFLPWVSIFGIGVVGIRGDGQVTLICAIIGLALLVISTRADGPSKTWMRVVAYVVAGIAVFVGVGDMNGAAAMGLYLTLFGSVGWVACLVWDGMERKKMAEATGGTVQEPSLDPGPPAT
jgi:hypothetical protein